MDFSHQEPATSNSYQYGSQHSSDMVYQFDKDNHPHIGEP